MPDSFRLLRNNKESGPFGLDELLQHSLRPFDLVWVEGKCAGWRYPSEIEILKPYLEEASEQNETIVVQQRETVATTQREAISQVTAPPAFIATDTTVDEDEITAEKLEKKANEIYLRVQAYAQQRALEGEGTPIKTARSLDDLKQEYADWLHKKNKKGKFSPTVKYMLPAIVIVLLTVGSFLFVSEKNTVEQVPVNESYYLSKAAEKPGDYKKQKNSTAHISSTTHSFAKAPAKKRLSVDEFLDSVHRELAKQDERLKKAALQSGFKKPVTNPQSASNATQQKIVGSQAQSLADQIGLDARYHQDRNKNITSLEITIRNNSSEILRTAAIDVFYYRAGDRLFDKQTVFITNVQPGNSFTLATPGNKKAQHAKFQLGKVE